MKYFNRKTVLITGSEGGLGKEFTSQLAAAGANLILTDIHPESTNRSEAVLGYLPCDLSAVSNCTTLVEKASRLGQIDFLINNAGIATIGEFSLVADEKWQTLMNINLIAPMALTRLVLPAMKQNGFGHIINISSLGGHIPVPTTASYAASKFGLRGFSGAVREEVKDDNIYISTVYPSFTDTAILNSERIGYRSESGIPPFLIDSPRHAVASIQKAVSRRQKEIYPSFQALLIAEAARLFPPVVPLITRSLQRMAD